MVPVPAKVREATRERVAAIRAKKTDEQIRQENEAAKLRMRELRARRTDWRGTKAQGPQSHTEFHTEFNCKVKKWRLMIAMGEDAGPEHMMANGKPEYCHHCDQDLKVPLAGKGRCPCYHCAVLFGTLDEWKKERDKENPNCQLYS